MRTWLGHWLVGATVMVWVSVAPGCSSCASTDTTALYPAPDGAGADGGGAVQRDGGMPLPDGARCPPRQIVCEGVCVDPAVDRAHCGGCNRVCDPGAECLSGRCACVGPDCGGVVGNPESCGGRSCDADQICFGNVCECRPGLSSVGGACVDLASDPDNCGSPGDRCPDGAVCLGGGCHGGCFDGTQLCNGGCVTLENDPLNCGECGNRCDRREVCAGGRCARYSGAGDCTTCPCRLCDAVRCCTLAVPGTDGVPICVDADGCP